VPESELHASIVAARKRRHIRPRRGNNGAGVNDRFARLTAGLSGATLFAALPAMPSPYRSIQREPATTIRVRRRWFGIVALALPLATFGAFAIYGSLGFELACSRAANTCSVENTIGPGIVHHRESIDLDTIKNAVNEIRPSEGDEGEPVFRVALWRRDGGLLYLDTGYWGFGRDEREAIVERTNAFLSDPFTAELRQGLALRWPFYLWLGTTFAFVLFMFRVTKLRIYPAERRLRIETRLGRTQDVELSWVRCAEVRDAVLLVPADEKDAELELIALDHLNDDEKARIVQAINDSLG
jgi:hypothetical protein